jgi:phosphoglucosamine mutase
MVLKIGQAIAVEFAPTARTRKIVIGKDTRLSSDMLESALAAGICSMGVDVDLAGVVPTPAVAHLTVAQKAAAGIVVSASHNPFQDNGIKLFSHKGIKLSVDQEAKLEALCALDTIPPASHDSRQIGRIDVIAESRERYVEFLNLGVGGDMDLAGLKVVLDCANGATFRVAPELYTILGADCVVLNTSPNGININDGCGSEHPRQLSREVVEHNAHVGFAFDGDGDRLIVVDENGHILTGDQLIAICASFLKRSGRLANNAVVSTVMSNLGLTLYLKNSGIDHYTTDVGDRHVAERMRAVGSVCGGENSGHYIFLEYHTTGDGLLSSLCLIKAMRYFKKPVSEMAHWMTVLPQQQVNIEVARKPPLDRIDGLADLSDNMKREMGGNGRILIRYSGTQPVCRVMVEGIDDATVRRYCRDLSDVIRGAIGK